MKDQFVCLDLVSGWWDGENLLDFQFRDNEKSLRVDVNKFSINQTQARYHKIGRKLLD